jgi:chromosome partitioning protein
MRTIALVTQKGGSGKSTLAACLAVAAQEAGERVFVIDMDPLKSLVNWSKLRGESDVAVEAVPYQKLPQVLTALERKGITLVIIDTPGTSSPATTAAMKSSDLCIIPARPNVFDLWASEVTRAAAKEARREFVFVLNQCPPSNQSARVEQGSKALEAMGGLLTPLISARVDFQEAARHGLGVTELAPYGDAADEIRKLWSSLKRRLGKVKQATKKAA